MKSPVSIYLKIVIILSLLFVSVGGIVYFKQDLNMHKLKDHSKMRQLYYLPAPKMLKRMSLGYTTLLADLIWIRGLLYVGTHFHQRGGIEWLPKYTRAIVRLDPKFRKAYLWGAVILLYNRTKAPRALELESIALLKEGQKVFPHDYYFPYMIGMGYLYEIEIARRNIDQISSDYFFFCRTKIPKKLKGKLVPMIKGVRKCLNQIASKHLLEAASKDNAPDHIALVGSRILRRVTSNKLMVCQHLMDTLWRAQSEDVRKKIRVRMHQYCGRKELRKILCQEHDFVRLWKKNSPYLSPTLFAVLKHSEQIKGSTAMAYPLRPTAAMKCLENEWQQELIEQQVLTSQQRQLQLKKSTSKPTSRSTSKPLTQKVTAQASSLPSK